MSVRACVCWRVSVRAWSELQPCVRLCVNARTCVSGSVRPSLSLPSARAHVVCDMACVCVHACVCERVFVYVRVLVAESTPRVPQITPRVPLEYP
jgi:hypothetical protein